jgi:hypothetical protein
MSYCATLTTAQNEKAHLQRGGKGGTLRRAQNFAFNYYLPI